MPNPYFTLKFRPNVALVSTVRRFVEEFFAEFLDDPDSTSRIALATHELLENAVKYASDEETVLAIEIFSGADGRRSVSIQTTNRAKPENIARVRALVDEMNQADPLAFYQTVMRRSLSVPVGSSGLGIARIRAECEMSVELKVDDGVVTLLVTAATEAAR